MSTVVRPSDLPSNVVLLSCADAAHRDFNISNHDVLSELLKSERKHFWFQCRNRFIMDRLSRLGLSPPASFMEVGCGSGTVLEHVLACGYRADGLDMHLDLARLAAGRCPQAGIYCADMMREACDRFEACYDILGLFDVLEHLDDPVRFLAQCTRLGRSGTTVVGTVPALNALWSRIDVLSGHKRRYNRQLMRSNLQDASLDIVHLEYFFHVLMPPLWLKRRWIERRHACGQIDGRQAGIENNRAPSAVVNGALAALCETERVISHCLPLGRLPGASLFFAARMV